MSRDPQAPGGGGAGPGPGGAPISFKTVPGRHRTQKWNKAANYSYDGDDWGGYDPYDEYGQEAPQQPAPPPLPAQASQLPSQRLRQRSFDQGDDGPRSVSAPFPSHGGPGPGSAASGGRGSNDFPRSTSRPRDFTNPESVPPPLMTRDAPAPSGWFPPRKSSLSGGSYEGQQQAAEAKAIAESITNPATNTGAADVGKPLPFIRPSDIYKRMEEEKRRESEESARPSLDSIQRVTSGDRKLDLTPVQEQRESQLFPDYGDAEPASAAPSSAVQTATAPAAPSKDTSPTLPLVSRFSGFGDDFLSQSGLKKHDDASSVLKSVPTLNTTGLPGAETASSSIQQTPVATRAPPGNDPAAEILAERQKETDGLQHQPSVGFRSAVHQAFDAEDATLSRDNSGSTLGGAGIGRSDTSATAGISPIMSRVPSSATAAFNQRQLGEQVPPISEETSGTTSSHPLPGASPSLGNSRSASREPAAFEPGYRRSLDPPSTGTSPARTPNLESTAGRRLSTPMSALVGDGETPDVVDQGAEVVEPNLHSAPTPLGELPPVDTSSLPKTGRGRSGTDYSVRESDIADTINASPDKAPISPELAEASRDSRDLFLATHNVQAPSSPLSPGGTVAASTPRADSPAKGRVREIANRYHEIHDASRRNSAASIGSSKSSWSRFGDDDKPNLRRAETSQSQLGQQVDTEDGAVGLSPPRPAFGREESFKPDLPGGWINSSAPTPAFEEPPKPEPTRDMGPPTPVDLTPTTKKYQLRESAPSSATAQSPADGARDIGNQLAASIISSHGVGHQTRDFASAEPAAPIDQPEMLPKRAYGDVPLAPPLLRHETGSSDAPTSVASSVAPTPPAKDTPKAQSELPPRNDGYFNTVAPLRLRSREPSPEHSAAALNAPESRQQHLGHVSSDNGADDEESDRLRREIVASLDEDTPRTQDALDDPDNERRVAQGEKLFPAAEAAAIGLGAAEVTDAASPRTASPPPKPGLLTTRFSWEAPAPVVAEEQQLDSPGIKPEAAYERPRSSRLHVMNPEDGQLDPDSPLKPAPGASRMSTNGPLAVPDLSRPEAAAAEEGIVRSLSQRIKLPDSSITPSHEDTIPESTAGPASPSRSLQELEPSPVSHRSPLIPSSYADPHIQNTDLPPEKDWTNSSTMPTATSPTRRKSAGKIPPFRTILNMKSPEERIHAYNETRQTFAEMNTGLGDWLTAMSAKHPEVFDAAESNRPPPLQTNSSAGGTTTWKRGHRPAPSIAGFKNRFASGSSATVDQQGRSTSIGSGAGPALDTSDTARPSGSAAGPGGIDMDRVQQQMQARGKEFVKNSKVLGGKASAGAKGLLAKGRSRFGGGGGSVRGKGGEVTSPPASPFTPKFLKFRSAPGSAATPALGIAEEKEPLSPADKSIATQPPPTLAQEQAIKSDKPSAVSDTSLAMEHRLPEEQAPDSALRAEPVESATAERSEKLVEDNSPPDTARAEMNQAIEGPTGIPSAADDSAASRSAQDAPLGASPIDPLLAEPERPRAPTPIEMLTEHGNATPLLGELQLPNDPAIDDVAAATSLVQAQPKEEVPTIDTAPSDALAVPAVDSGTTIPGSSGTLAPSSTFASAFEKRHDLSRHTSASSTSAFRRRDGASTPSSSRSASRLSVFERLRQKARSMSRSRKEGSRSRPASLVLSHSNLLSDENLAEPKTAVLVGEAKINREEDTPRPNTNAFPLDDFSDVAVDPTWKPTSATSPLEAPASPPRVEAWNDPDAQLPLKTPTGRTVERNVGRLGVLPSPAPTAITFAEGERHASLEQARRRNSAAAVSGQTNWRRGLEERFGGGLEPLPSRACSHGETEMVSDELMAAEGNPAEGLGLITNTSGKLLEQEHTPPTISMAAPRPGPQQRKVSDISSLPSQQHRASESQSPLSSRPTSADLGAGNSSRVGMLVESSVLRSRSGSMAVVSPTSNNGSQISGLIDSEILEASPTTIKNVEAVEVSEMGRRNDLQKSVPSESTLWSKEIEAQEKLVARQGGQRQDGAVGETAGARGALADIIASATARKMKREDANASSPSATGSLPAKRQLSEAQPDSYVLRDEVADKRRPSSADKWEDARSEVSVEQGEQNDERRERHGVAGSRKSSISSLGAGDVRSTVEPGAAQGSQDRVERQPVVSDESMSHQAVPAGPTGASPVSPFVTNFGQQVLRLAHSNNASHPGMPDRPLSYMPSPRDGDGYAQDRITTATDMRSSVSPAVDLSLVSGPPAGTPPFQQHPVFRNSSSSVGNAQPAEYERMRSTSRLSGVLMSPGLDRVEDPMQASRPQSGFFRRGDSAPTTGGIPSRDTISDLHGLEDVHAWGVETATTPNEEASPAAPQQIDQKQARRKSAIWQAFSSRRSSMQAKLDSQNSTTTPLASLENVDPSSIPAQPLDPLERSDSSKRKMKTLQKPQRANSNAVQLGGEPKKKRFSGLKSLLGWSSTTAGGSSKAARDDNVKDRPEPAKKLRKMAPSAAENVKPMASPPMYQGRPTNPATVLGSMSGYQEYEAARRREMARAAIGMPPPQQEFRPPPAAVSGEPPPDGWYGPSSREQEGRAHVTPTYESRAMPEFRRLHSRGPASQERSVVRVPEAFRPVEASFGSQATPIGPPLEQTQSTRDLGPDEGHSGSYLGLSQGIGLRQPSPHHQIDPSQSLSQPKIRGAGSAPALQTHESGRVVSVGTELARSPAKEYGDQQTPWSIILPGGGSAQGSRQTSWSIPPQQQQQQVRRQSAEYHRQPPNDLYPRQSQGEEYHEPHPEDARLYNDRGPYPSPPYSPDLARPPPGENQPQNWMSRQVFSQSTNAGYSHPSQNPMYQAAGAGSVSQQWFPRQPPPPQPYHYHSRPPPAGMNRYYSGGQHRPPSAGGGYQRHHSADSANGIVMPYSQQQRRPSSGGYIGRRDEATFGEEELIMRGASYPGQEWAPMEPGREEGRWR